MKHWLGFEPANGQRLGSLNFCENITTLLKEPETQWSQNSELYQE